MTIWGVFACESTYGGLHGMKDQFFTEGTEQSAEREMYIASEEVMMSYDLIGEYIGEREFDSDEDWDAAVSEAIAELSAGYLVRIRDDCPLTLEELNARAYNEFEELCDFYGERVE